MLYHPSAAQSVNACVMALRQSNEKDASIDLCLLRNTRRSGEMDDNTWEANNQDASVDIHSDSSEVGITSQCFVSGGADFVENALTRFESFCGAFLCLFVRFH